MKKLSTKILVCIVLITLTISEIASAQLPTVTSVNPMAANPGATVTLTGINFNTTPANNIVYFGATRATVTASSTTTLTATVPVGATYKEVSVNNTASALTAYSQYPFLPTFDNSATNPSTISMASQVTFATGSNPRGSDIGDIDGDGKPDIAVTNISANTVSVYRNTSSSGSITSGSFATAVTFATGTSPISVAIGDIDGDGKPELVVANAASANVSVLRNTSTSGTITSGSFATQVNFATGTSPHKIALGDIDGDGKLDIAVPNQTASTVSVLRNTSSSGTITSGSFATQVTFSAGTNPFSVGIGDIDGDGKPDMAVANSVSNNVSVYRNTSTSGTITSGSFATPVTFATTNPLFVALNDIDGDGKADMAVTNNTSSTVSVFRNTSTSGSITSGSFATQVTFATGVTPVYMAIGDINGDGKPDMAVANYGSASVSVLRNTSSSGSITSGSFAAQVTYATGTQPFSVAIGDLDGDNLPDIVAPNQISGTVSVIRNNPTFLPTTVTSVNPTAANPGATVTLTGTSFSATPANNIVYFGATRATVTASSTTTLTATVPLGATYNRVSVNNTASALTGYSQYPFLPTYHNSAFVPATVNFNSQVTFSAGTSPAGIALGDIDGDGKPDMVVAGAGSNTISVYHNTSSSGSVTSGSFATAVTFATGSQPNGIAIGDLDGDGKPDIVVGNNGSANISILRNTSSSGSITSGSFATQVTFATGTSPRSVAIGDIDGDGKPDLVVANFASNIVSVFRNTSSSGSITSGSFATGVTFATGSFPRSVAIGDIDGDGKPDLVLANSLSNTVSVLRNTSTIGTVTSGSFATQVTFAAENNPYDIAIGDIDGDGKSDLAVTNNQTHNVSIYRNTSTSGTITSGSFAAHVTFATGTLPFGVSIGDIDGDGKPDLAVANISTSNVSVLRNTSSSGSITSSSFAPQVTFATGSFSEKVAIGDIDGDGRPDLAVANNGSANVSVLRNNPLSPTTGTAQVCVGSTTTLANATTGGTWSSSNAAIATVGSSSGIVTGVSGGTVTITYAGTAGASFDDNRITTVVTVNASPAVSAGSNVAICSGVSSGLTASGADTYTWSPSTGLSATTGATVTANPSSTITYTVTGTDGTGCSNTATKTVSVNALPTVSAGSNVAICAGSSTNITATGAVDYTWSPATGLSATTGATVTANPTSTITYTVTGSDGSGCSNTATKTVSVNALPTVSAGSNVAICTGSSTNITATGAVDYTWSPGTSLSATTGATVSANPTSTITYTVTGTDGNGCSNTATKTVSVNATLAVSAGGTVSICTGNSTNITATGAVDYTWSPATGLSATTGATVTANPSSTITYTVTGTDGTGCSNTATKTVSVNALPSVSAGSNVAICTGSSTNITATGAVDYTWSPGTSLSATTGATVSANPSSTITYTVTGTNVNGCTSTATKTVSVTTTLAVSAGGTVSICTGNSTNITATGAVDYTWSPATGLSATTGATVTANPSSTITYTVTGSDGSGCSNTATKTVSVNPFPSAISVPPLLCPTESATLTSASLGGTWSSANSTVVSVNATTGEITAVVNNYSSTSITFITYTLPGGCTTSRMVTVKPVPAPIYGGTAALCLGETTTLSSGTTGQTWSSSTLGVATVVPGGVVTGVGAGTTTISYTNSGGCATTKIVTVNGPLPANTGTLTVCTGQTTMLANATPGGTWSTSNAARAIVNSLTGLVSGVTGGTVNISYRIGSTCFSVSQVTVNSNTAVIGGTQTACVGITTTLTYPVSGGTWSSATPAVATIDLNSGVVTGVGIGTSEITYTVAAGCFKTTVVTVTALPAAITGTALLCQAATTTLSSGSGTWSSSNTGIATVNSTGVVTGVSSGNANITFRATGTGCYVTRVVTVNPTPAIVSASVCPAQTATLTATPSGGTWSVSNPSVATINATTGVLTGVIVFNSGISTTIVTNTLATGCSKTAVVTVYPVPSVISGGIRSICTGSTTTLTSSTTGATWSSTTPGVATISPVGLVTGIGAGTSTISYTNSFGCVATAGMTVSALPVVTPITGTRTVCMSATTTLGSTPGGGVWSSSNAARATVNSSGVVSGINPGTVIITYTVGSGCSAFETALVTVNAVPGVTPILGTLVVCAQATTALSSTSVGGVWSSSVPAVGSIGTNGVVSGVTAGNTTISYTLTNGFGCQGRSTAVVTVNPLPVVAAITGTLSVCKDATTALSSVTGGGVWTSSTPSVATVGVTGIVTGVNAGTATISYTVTNGFGCVTRVTGVVTVNPLPLVSNVSGIYTVCANALMTLSASLLPGTWTSGNVSTATIGNIDGVITPVAVGTSLMSYRVTATGCIGTREITVIEVPTAIVGATALCPGATATLTSTPSGGTWTAFNSGVISINATTGAMAAVIVGHSGISVTAITYTIPNGCSRVVYPTVNPIPSPIYGGATALCLGDTTTLLSGTPGQTWSSSTPGVATVGLSGFVTSVGAGTTSISYTNSMGCAATKVVTVNGTVPANTGTLTVCTGQSTMLANTNAGGTWSTSNASIATVNTLTGLVSGINGGTVSISYRIGPSCFSVSQVTVNSNVAVIGGTRTACIGTTTALTYPVSGGTWSSTTPAVATIDLNSGVVTGAGIGTSEITYTIAGGCFKTTIVTVTALPAAITGTALLCQAATTALSNGSGTWSSSSTGIATVNSTGVVTGVSAGNANITFRASGTGCYVTRVVTVNPTPAIVSASVCPAQTATLTATPSGGTWSISNPSVATINATTGVLTGVIVFNTGISTTIVTNTLATGCSKTAVVTVYPVPSVISGGITSICTGSTTTLSSSTTGATWSSTNTGVATISPVGLVTGIGAGTSTISYTNSFGCVATTGMTVSAIPAVTPITGTLTVCVSATTTLGSTPGSGIWSSSNTTIATVNSSGVVSGINPGTVSITYTVGSGCAAFETTIVTVNTTPSTITGTRSVCIGAATTLGSTPSGGTWSSSADGIASVGSTTGIVNGISDGTAIVTYTLLGCTRAAEVTVNALPASITGTGVTCAGGGTTALTNVSGTWTSSNTGIATVNYLGTVTGVTAGNAIITFRNASNCSTTREVTINPLPSTIVIPTGLCLGTTGTFTATPSGGTWVSANPSVFSVDGSSGAMTALIANYTSNSVGTVSYTLPTGCVRTGIVTVNRQPGNIYGGTGNVCAGATTAQFSSATDCTWSSATPSVATISPTGVVTGVSAGNTVISYTSAAGCAAQRVITVNATPDIITGATSVLVGQTTTLANALVGGIWSSSVTSKATIGSVSGTVTGINTGTTNITYMMSTGCFVARAMNIAAARGADETVKEVVVTEVKLYPNPTTGTFTIAIPIEGIVNVYTIDGKELQQYEVKAGNTGITLPEGLANGVYMLRFIGADGSSKMIRLVYQQ